ncbi:flagellar assembly protein FliH [Pseudohongiella sp. O18]|uniref:flagellar assembly protein FliH n=1 Tax=Pseudohongiella sp. O18 TaxID=2904248 RepID=UPI001F3C069B|nr:flagellar assembly protein FliH [Pseudohongiella sp. O18]
MQRHIFDGTNRVSQKAVESQRIMRWAPPTIDKAGKLVQVEPRAESQFRQTVTAHQGAAAEAGAGAEDGQVSDFQGTGTGYDEGYEQGLMLGRSEGLKKGLEEGRQQGHKLGFEQGHAEGFEKGTAEGLQQGLQDADQQVRQQLNVLNSVMTHLTHALNEQDYQLEQALLGIVREVSRQVIQRELSIDSKHIMQIVQQALNTLPPTRDNVRILVNSADKELVMRAAEEGGENWRVIGSAQIERGGCRVETDHSAVDFTVSTRFNQAVEQIVAKQFMEDDDPRQKGVPPGEDLQAAPEPVVKTSSAKASKRSLAEEAADLGSATDIASEQES